jgi:hypothetical protein
MRKSIALLALLAAAIPACSNTATESLLIIDPPMVGRYQVEVTATGGFAALSIHQIVTHEDGHFLYTLGSLCAAQCQPARDSVAGTLSSAAANSLFGAVFAENPTALEDDYGTTPQSADMMSYTLRITMNDLTKTVHADDGTMPPQMRRIVDAVRAAISAARQ